MSISLFNKDVSGSQEFSVQWNNKVIKIYQQYFFEVEWNVLFL